MSWLNYVLSGTDELSHNGGGSAHSDRLGQGRGSETRDGSESKPSSDTHTGAGVQSRDNSKDRVPHNTCSRDSSHSEPSSSLRNGGNNRTLHRSNDCSSSVTSTPSSSIMDATEGSPAAARRRDSKPKDDSITHNGTCGMLC